MSFTDWDMSKSESWTLNNEISRSGEYSLQNLDESQYLYIENNKILNATTLTTKVSSTTPLGSFGVSGGNRNYVLYLCLASETDYFYFYPYYSRIKIKIGGVDVYSTVDESGLEAEIEAAIETDEHGWITFRVDLDYRVENGIDYWYFRLYCRKSNLTWKLLLERHLSNIGQLPVGTKKIQIRQTNKTLLDDIYIGVP